MWLGLAEIVSGIVGTCAFITLCLIYPEWTRRKLLYHGAAALFLGVFAGFVVEWGRSLEHHRELALYGSIGGLLVFLFGIIRVTDHRPWRKYFPLAWAEDAWRWLLIGGVVIAYALVVLVWGHWWFQ